MITPTHRLTILTNQEQIEQITLFLMQTGCSYTVQPIEQLSVPTNSKVGSNSQKGLSLRILRAATANGSKGIHRKTITQIGQEAGVTPSLIETTMNSLVETGKLTSVGRGLYKRAA